jgi:GH24 family phage-related lysozyme (muramidase)
MGGSTTTNTSSDTTPDAQLLGAYRGLLPMAQAAANTQYDPRTGQRVAGFSDMQNQYFGGVSGLQGYGSSGMAGAINQMGASSAPLSADQINQYMNPYTQNVINSSLANLDIEQGKAQQGVQAGAIAQNALGGNRAMLQANDLQRQQDLAKGSMISGLQSQAYQQAVNTATQQQGIGMQGAQGLAGLYGAGQGLTLQQLGALGSAGAQQQGLTQAQYDAATKNAQAQFMLPYQNAQYLAGILGSANMGSHTTGTSTTQENPGVGAIAGQALGAMAMFSDKRLKDDIEHIGYSFGGKPIYSYRMKGEGPKQLGFMAQDLEHTHPHAVGHIGGLKTVNYDAATRDDVAKGHFADGGHVGRFADGGTNMFGDMGESSFMPWTTLGRAAAPQAPQQAAAAPSKGGGFGDALKQGQAAVKAGQDAGKGLSNLNQKLGDAVYGNSSGQGPGGWGASIEPASFTQGLGLGFADGGLVSENPFSPGGHTSLGHMNAVREIGPSSGGMTGFGGGTLNIPHSVFGQGGFPSITEENGRPMASVSTPEGYAALAHGQPSMANPMHGQPSMANPFSPSPTAPPGGQPSMANPIPSQFTPNQASVFSPAANPFNPSPTAPPGGQPSMANPNSGPQSPSGGLKAGRFAPTRADGGSLAGDPSAFSNAMVHSKPAGLGGLAGGLGGGGNLLSGFASGGGVRGFADPEGGTVIGSSQVPNDDDEVHTIDDVQAAKNAAARTAPLAKSPLAGNSDEDKYVPPPMWGKGTLDSPLIGAPGTVLGDLFSGRSKAPAAPPPSVQTATAAQPAQSPAQNAASAAQPQKPDTAAQIADWTAKNPLPAAPQPPAATTPVGKIQLNPTPPVSTGAEKPLDEGAVAPLPDTEPSITTSAASKVTPVKTTVEGAASEVPRPVKSYRVYPTADEKADVAAPTEGPKQFSPEGLSKLEEFEGGYQLKPFKDAGVMSIGLGTRAQPGDEAGITEQEARRRATAETAGLSDRINSSVRVPLSQAQHDALVRFGFQEGAGALDKIVKTLNTEGPEAAAARIQRYKYVTNPATGEMEESAHVKMRMAHESAALTGKEAPEGEQQPARRVGRAGLDESGNVKFAKKAEKEAEPEGDIFTRTIGFNPLQPFTGVAPGSKGWNPMGWTPQQQEKLAAFGLGMAGNVMRPFQGGAEGLQRGQQMQLQQAEFGLKSMMEPAKLSLEAEKIRQGRYIVHQTGVDNYGFPVYTTIDTKTGLPVHAGGVSPGAMGGAGAAGTPGLGAGQSGGFNTGPAVGSALHGDEFLKTVHPAYAARIKAEGDYDAPPSAVTNSPQSMAYNAMLRQYRPDFDTTGFKQKQDAVKDFQTGEARKAIDAGRLAIGHLGEYSDAFEGMGNSRLPIVNRIKQWVASESGSDRTSAVDAIKGSLATELAKFYKGASPTGHEAEEALALLDNAKSPEQMRTALLEISKMMGNRVSNFENRRDQVGLDAKRFPIWTPKEEQILDKINSRKAGRKVENAPERPLAPERAAAPSLMPRPNKSEAEIIADAKEYLHRPDADIPALAAHLRAWGIAVNKVTQ